MMYTNKTLNTSDTLATFYCDYTPPEPESNWAKAAAYLVILLTAFVGNIIVIKVFTTSQRLRTEVNLLIVNMAVADVMTSLFNMTFFVRHFVRLALELPQVWFGGVFGMFLCKFVDFIQGVSMFCCVLTLTAIAFNRFFAVLFPLKSVMNPQFTKVLILLIWLCACVFASPTLYVMQVVTSPEDGNYYCIENWAPVFDNETTPKYYTLGIFIIMYAIPLTFITFLYACVIRKVWIRQVPGNKTRANQRLEGSMKKRVLKMLITVVVVFALCWLPFHIYLLLVNFYYGIYSCEISPVILFVGLFLGHANSAINPWIYFMFNKDYRKNIKDMCQTSCAKQIQASKGPSHYSFTRNSTMKTGSSLQNGSHDSNEIELSLMNGGDKV